MNSCTQRHAKSGHMNNTKLRRPIPQAVALVLPDRQARNRLPLPLVLAMALAASLSLWVAMVLQS